MTTLPRLAPVETPPRRADLVADAVGKGAGDHPWAHRRGQRPPSVFRSLLAMRIVGVNLVLAATLIGTALFLNPFRHSLVAQRLAGLEAEAHFVAHVLATAAAEGGPDASAIVGSMAGLDAGGNAEIFVFAADGDLVAHRDGIQPQPGTDQPGPVPAGGGSPGAEAAGKASLTGEALARSLLVPSVPGTIMADRLLDPKGSGTVLAVAVPVGSERGRGDVVVVTAPQGEAARLEGRERLHLLLIFAAAMAIALVLSLVLAASITRPLSELALAAEKGRDRHDGKMTRGRVRIPDLAKRPDEIGRLSKAMRGMVTALYDRIDANEQFAADVAHEIKNPLASLRAAVGTLRGTRRDDQRDRLLDVIEHDVRRLDRLVSDISSASRLDSDLVREESVRLNLLRMLSGMGEHLGRQAAETGVQFIIDLPPEPILIDGLEARLAQVFVNLVTNAISFCDEGDAVRLWARRRENRVLIVVEDTGPGIPEAALAKVFDRFYSERPELDFGNHSGLGLAISKQIVEAHGGVIWAENIRPTDADITSEPLGARFVVGLPV